MTQKKEIELISKSVALDLEAYKILEKIKIKLIEKHKRAFSFSDSVRELKRENKIKNE